MFTYRLHDDENLLHIYRKHELVLAPKIFQVFILIFVPWYFGIKYNFVAGSPGHLKLFAVWTLLVAIYAVYAFMIWAINVYIITSKRLVHIAHTNPFHKVVNETPLDRVLNVSFRTTGFFSTIFHYGDVLVQVVGLEQPLIFQDVPDPLGVKDFIWKIHLEYGGEQKITYTKPEIAPVDKNIPYAPNMPTRTLVKKRKV